MFKSKKAKAENLMATGAKAVGTLTSVRDTGMTINDNPRVLMTFNIEPLDGSPAFEGDEEVDRLARVDPPARLPLPGLVRRRGHVELHVRDGHRPERPPADRPDVR